MSANSAHPRDAGECLANRLLEIGLIALDAVFGDAVLEAGWFDERVLNLLYPVGKLPLSINAAERARRKTALARQVPMLRTRENFEAAAGKASPGWVRGCVAVMLFGGWQKGRWQLTATMIKRHKRDLNELIARLRVERDALDMSPGLSEARR